MQPLETTFDLGNYRHTQLYREGMWAIYEQRHKEADVMRYEVIRIRIAPEKVWPNGSVTPEREAYPGSSVWGRDGWTCFTRQEADTLLAREQRRTDIS